MTLRAFPSGTAHPRRARRIGQYVLQSVGQRVGVAGRAQPAGDPVLDDLGATRHGCRHHRKSARHGLEQHRRQSVPVAAFGDNAGQHRRFGLGHTQDQFLLRQRAVQPDAILKPEALDPGPQLLLHRTRPDHRQLEFDTARLQEGAGPDQDVESLFRHHPSHRDQPPAFLCRRIDGCERGEVDAVVEPDHPGLGAEIRQVAGVILRDGRHEGGLAHFRAAHCGVGLGRDVGVIDVLRVCGEGKRAAQFACGKTGNCRGVRAEMGVQVADSTHGGRAGYGDGLGLERSDLGGCLAREQGLVFGFGHAQFPFSDRFQNTHLGLQIGKTGVARFVRRCEQRENMHLGA